MGCAHQWKLEYVRRARIQTTWCAQESTMVVTLLGQGPVTGIGEKICRQVVKYAYNRDIPFVAAFDWETLILLRLRGLKPSWHGEQAYAPGIEADGAWLTRKGDFKRALFVWLKMSLEATLQRFDKNLYSRS
jgi:hypothetical protein